MYYMVECYVNKSHIVKVMYNVMKHYKYKLKMVKVEHYDQKVEGIKFIFWYHSNLVGDNKVQSRERQMCHGGAVIKCAEPQVQGSRFSNKDCHIPSPQKCKEREQYSSTWRS